MKKNNEILYSNEFLDIEMINPNYPFLVMKKNGVVVVPYDKEGNIYLLNKNRPNVGQYYEVPRGFVEHKEDYKSGAVRELLEETGLEAKEVTTLGVVQPDTGVMSNSVQMYAMLVEDKEDYFEHYDTSDKELSKVVKVSFNDINNFIMKGQIICSYTLSSLFTFKAHSLVK